MDDGRSEGDNDDDDNNDDDDDNDIVKSTKHDDATPQLPTHEASRRDTECDKARSQTCLTRTNDVPAVFCSTWERREGGGEGKKK
jgi:hypothetical protein